MLKVDVTTSGGVAVAGLTVDGSTKVGGGPVGVLVKIGVTGVVLVVIGALVALRVGAGGVVIGAGATVLVVLLTGADVATVREAVITLPTSVVAVVVAWVVVVVFKVVMGGVVVLIRTVVLETGVVLVRAVVPETGLVLVRVTVLVIGLVTTGGVVLLVLVTEVEIGRVVVVGITTITVVGLEVVTPPGATSYRRVTGGTGNLIACRLSRIERVFGLSAVLVSLGNCIS